MSDQHIKQDLAGLAVMMAVLVGIIVGLKVADSKTNFVTKTGQSIYQSIIK